jgi:hypothetical protein
VEESDVLWLLELRSHGKRLFERVEK